MIMQYIMKSLCFICLISIASFAFAGTIYLKDGSIVKGRILTEDWEAVIIKTDFGELTIKKSEIEKMEYDDNDITLRVIVGRANIRQEPTTEAPIVGSAKNGDILPLIDKKGNWYQIRFTDEQGDIRLGYIYASLVEEVELAYLAERYSPLLAPDIEEGTEVIVSLKDGTSLKGKLVKKDYKSITLQTLVGELTIQADKISNIEEVKPVVVEEKEVKAEVPVTKKIGEPKVAQKKKFNFSVGFYGVEEDSFGYGLGFRCWFDEKIGIEGIFTTGFSGPFPSVSYEATDWWGDVYSAKTSGRGFLIRGLYRIWNLYQIPETFRGLFMYASAGLVVNRVTYTFKKLGTFVSWENKLKASSDAIELAMGIETILRKYPLSFVAELGLKIPSSYTLVIEEELIKESIKIDSRAIYFMFSVRYCF